MEAPKVAEDFILSQSREPRPIFSVSKRSIQLPYVPKGRKGPTRFHPAFLGPLGVLPVTLPGQLALGNGVVRLRDGTQPSN